MKVAVVGYAGSGKSTFARRLGDALCIPVQHLDQVFYTSNWQERDKGEARDLAEAFLDVNDAWVVDGTYHRLALARRLEAADVIVIFAFRVAPAWLKRGAAPAAMRIAFAPTWPTAALSGSTRSSFYGWFGKAARARIESASRRSAATMRKKRSS